MAAYTAASAGGHPRQADDAGGSPLPPAVVVRAWLLGRFTALRDPEETLLRASSRFWRGGIVRRPDGRDGLMVPWSRAVTPRRKHIGGRRSDLPAKAGERVFTGQPIVELRGDDSTRLEAAVAELAGAVEIGDDPPTRSLVLERIGC